MPRHRREIAARIAENLFDVENAVDTAITKASGLLGTLPVARIDARVAATTGQPAFDRVVAAIAALNDARREMCEAHRALFEVQQQFGLGEVAFGGLIDKPEYPPKAQLRESRLKVVGDQVA
ncbi:MAG: hypothetical protein SNJ79_11140 [Sphingomonadaceae bacterium]